MCEHFKELYSSMNQYFPNGKHIMLQNHAWVKNLAYKTDQWI